jgi:periplasmic protein CpxP/Spy
MKGTPAMLSIRNRIATSTAAALLGTCLLAAPIGAFAQQSAPPTTPAQAAPAQAKATHSSKVEARIKSLHAQLKITPAEEQEWSAVAQTMRDNATEMDQLVQQRMKQRTGLNAVDDMKSYEAIVQAHANEMQKLVPAFEALYTKMSASQQKLADNVINERTASRRAATSKKG